jgi:hypothetical protein
LSRLLLEEQNLQLNNKKKFPEKGCEVVISGDQREDQGKKYLCTMELKE